MLKVVLIYIRSGVCLSYSICQTILELPKSQQIAITQIVWHAYCMGLERESSVAGFLPKT